MELIAHGKGKIPTYVEGKTVINGSYEDVKTIIVGLGDFSGEEKHGYRYSYGVRMYRENGKNVESYSKGTLDKSNKECFSFVKLNPKPLTEDTTELYFRAGKRNYMVEGNIRLVQFCVGFLVLVSVGTMMFFTITEWFTPGLFLGTIGTFIFWPLWIKLLFFTRKKSYSPEAQMKLFENSIIKHINWQLGILQKAKAKLKREEEKLNQQ